MPFKTISFATIQPAGTLYLQSGLGLINYPDTNGQLGIFAGNDIISEFAAAFFPTPAAYAYVCTWVLSLRILNTDFTPFKTFDGAIPRRDFGFWAMGREEGIVADGLINYTAQITTKGAFMFSPAQTDRLPPVAPIPVPPNVADRYYGNRLNFAGSAAPANAGLLPGADRVVIRTRKGAVARPQLQYQLSLLDLSFDGLGTFIGDVL